MHGARSYARWGVVASLFFDCACASRPASAPASTANPAPAPSREERPTPNLPARVRRTALEHVRGGVFDSADELSGFAVRASSKTRASTAADADACRFELVLVLIPTSWDREPRYMLVSYSDRTQRGIKWLPEDSPAAHLSEPLSERLPDAPFTRDVLSGLPLMGRERVLEQCPALEIVYTPIKIWSLRFQEGTKCFDLAYTLSITDSGDFVAVDERPRCVH